jgi:hypothetical protein
MPVPIATGRAWLNRSGCRAPIVAPPDRTGDDAGADRDGRCFAGSDAMPAMVRQSAALARTVPRDCGVGGAALYANAVRAAGADRAGRHASAAAVS